MRILNERETPDLPLQFRHNFFGALRTDAVQSSQIRCVAAIDRLGNLRNRFTQRSYCRAGADSRDGDKLQKEIPFHFV